MSTMASIIPLPRSEALARPLRAALYGRASRDRHKRGRSVKDQFTVGEMVCADYGWTIVDYYEDLDRSASRHATKAREHFERMVTDMEAGLIDVVVYAERSRLSRNMHVSLRLRDLCEQTGILLYYDGRLFDMRAPSDFREFTRDALQAEEEAESITSRNVRTVNLNAKRGGIHGPVAFGFKREYDPDTGELVGQVPHPTEASVVTELFQRVDEHESLTSLVPLVRPWRPDINTAGLRVILRNKSYIGVRVHGKAEYEAAWDGFIAPAVFWRVQALLEDPSRRTNYTSGAAHLLTGSALCAACRRGGDFKTARMRAYPGYAKTNSRPCYRCRQNHLSIVEAKLDAFVEEAVLTWLESPKAREVFRRKDSSGELEHEKFKLGALTSQLEEAREQAAEFDPVTGTFKLSPASLAALEQRIMPLLSESEGKIRRLLTAGDPLIDQLLNADAAELDRTWSLDMTLDQRRYVVRRVVRIEVDRAPSSSRYTPVSERVRLIFAGEPGFEEWPLEPSVDGESRSV